MSARHQDARAGDRFEVGPEVIATTMKKVRRGEMLRFIGSPFDLRLIGARP